MKEEAGSLVKWFLDIFLVDFFKVCSFKYSFILKDNIIDTYIQTNMMTFIQTNYQYITQSLSFVLFRSLSFILLLDFDPPWRISSFFASFEGYGLFAFLVGPFAGP